VIRYMEFFLKSRLPVVRASELTWLLLGILDDILDLANVEINKLILLEMGEFLNTKTKNLQFDNQTHWV